MSRFSISGRSVFVGGALTLGLVGALLAAYPAAPQGPTRIATVDLQAVIDKLQEKQDWEIKLKSLQDRIVEEVNLRKKKLQELVDGVNAITDPDKKLVALEAAELEKLETEQWADLKSNELDRETSLMWRQIYKHVRDEAAKLAEEKGYDYVIVAEPAEDLPAPTPDRRVPQWQQTLQAISQRKLLFASPSHNISDELAARMNNSNVAGSTSTSAPAHTNSTPKPAPSGTPRGGKNP